MKKIILGTLIAAASLMAANYAACAGCHGQKGEKKALGKSAKIQGWPAEKTIAAMNGYKDGSYIKQWQGREDNEHLVEVMAEMDLSLPNIQQQVYSALESRYPS